MSKLTSTVIAVTLLAGCASQPAEQTGAPARAAIAIPAAPAPVAPGATYSPGGSTFDLFMDLRARAVGDILTVALVERTNASKESSTNTSRSASVDTGLPIFAGRPITSNGTPVLNNELESSSNFGGGADASQSNSLDGSITVTVVDRLANGNLLVRGEKWITLNQGEEFIELEGIVRPVDIGPDNTVASTRVADARITYSGKGSLADANRPGWLARFFNSPWFPF